MLIEIEKVKEIVKQLEITNGDNSDYCFGRNECVECVLGKLNELKTYTDIALEAIQAIRNVETTREQYLLAKLKYDHMAKITAMKKQSNDKENENCKSRDNDHI